MYYYGFDRSLIADIKPTFGEQGRVNAWAADVVLFFGGLNKNFQQDCEGDDRKSMDLPFGQDELLDEILKVNKNVGVIIVSGNAVSMPWLDKVNGLMQSWYLGSEAGNATARVISGEVSPSGKLPFSIPRRLEDNGAHYFGEKSYPGDGRKPFHTGNGTGIPGGTIY